MKLLLVRHGETEWNKLGKFQGQKDVSMTARGVAQASETGRALSGEGIVSIYASPLMRTMQFAGEVSRETGLPVVPAPGLEELDLGELEGVTGREMRTGWPEVYAAWREDPTNVVLPKGESLAQLQERAWRSLMQIEQAHQADDILVVVSHNFTIRAIVGRVLGMTLSNFHNMTLGLSSISTVESSNENHRLVNYNVTSHLSPENR